MARLHLHAIGSELDALIGADDAARNAEHMAGLDTALGEKVDAVHAGWGAKYVDRVHAKGKMTTWERLRALIDEGSELYEVGTLVNWGRRFEGSRREAPGAGVVTAFARVQERWCVVIANDNTVASGAWWPLTPEKIERAQEMALRLRLPVIYLVDCSGLFLPEQSRSFSGARGAGHIFKQNARLADAGVPQVAAVFGDCIAGGGYMPIISDRVYMTESAYMVIAGAALIRGAKSQKLTSLDIGGPEVHVHQSRCADVRVPDDATALDAIRQAIAALPSSAAAFYRHGAEALPPRFATDELASLFPTDPRQGYPIEEVIARLVDHSMFHEWLPHSGREMVTGLARIQGLWVGLIANRQGIVDEPGIGKRPGGALYREGIAKISSFSRACDHDGIPIIWLQDISGFDIGVEAEAQGLLGYGSNLIYTNSTNQTPMFTVLLRKASGAGYYAMAGLPYDPVVQLATPLTRLAVMEGRTLAIATYNSKLDDDFEIATEDPEERAAIEAGMRDVASRIEADMDPVRAAARMDCDEIVPVEALRGWLECLVESAWQSTGYRRTKNPRIWSMHDAEVLARSPSHSAVASWPGVRSGRTVQSPSVGTWYPEVALGSPVGEGTVLGRLRRSGAELEITAPKGVQGVVTRGAPAGGALVYGDELVALGDSSGEFQSVEDEAAEDMPEGVTAIRAETDGTVYLRPSPDAAPYASEGDALAARDTLALIEVMKTFTPVRVERGGVVVKVLVDDGQAITAGEAVAWIRVQ